MPPWGMWFAYLVWALPVLLIAGSIVLVGYFAYRSRIVREDRELYPEPAPGPDPVEELARVNDELTAELGNARRTLASARDAIRKGVR